MWCGFWVIITYALYTRSTQSTERASNTGNQSIGYSPIPILVDTIVNHNYSLIVLSSISTILHYIGWFTLHNTISWWTYGVRNLQRWKSLSTPLETLRIQNHVTQIIIKYNSSQYSKEDKTQWRIDCSCERQGLGLRTLFGRGVNNHPGG